MRQVTIPAASLALLVVLAAFVGCRSGAGAIAVMDGPLPLGAVVDPHWQLQQTNAQASEFVIYQHEFIGATAQLTPAGMEHVKQIARRMADVPFPVLIEPVTFRPFDNHRYEEKEFTDTNRERREILELDHARREIIDADRRAEIDAARRQEVAQFLAALGYGAANDRVFVSQPYLPGISGQEGQRNYQRMLSNNGGGAGGTGGRGGGFGGGAGF